MRLKFCALCVSVIAAATLLSAAQGGAPPAAPSSSPVFRAGVSVVSFDVTVLDAERRPVRGLTAADFVVTENDVPQHVTAVTEISIPPPDMTGASWTREIGSDVVTNSLDSKRLVVIVMDDGGVGTDGAQLAIKTAHAAIDELGPSDLASVVHTYLGRMENFAADRAKLRAAVDAFKPQFFPNKFFDGTPLACALKQAQFCFVEVLTRVGDILRRAPAGRKMVVLISPGPHFSQDLHLNFESLLPPVRTALEKLQAANVTVYTFNPNGLTASAGRPDPIGMAEQTGGRAVGSTNAPDELVSEVFHESSSYYLVGYESTDTRVDGRFRNVRVRVTRPGLTVLARNGYYAPRPSADRPAPSKLAPEDEAIARGLPSGDLPISVTAAAFAGFTPRVADVVAVMKLREPTPVDGAGPPSRRVNVVMAAFDTSWKSRGVFKQGVDLTLALGANRESEYEVSTRLPLAPGRYELRFATERSGVAGSAFVSIDVPDFAREPLSLSGLLVERLPPGLTAVKNLGIVPIVPTTARTFRPSDRAAIFLRAYQGSTRLFQPVTITTVIQDRQGVEAARSEQSLTPAAFAASRWADYRFELPIAKLMPGEYLLTTTASIRDRRAERTLRFEVRPQ